MKISLLRTMKIRSLVIYLSLLVSTPLPVACKHNGYTVLFFGVFPSDLYALLAWRRSGGTDAVKIECAHRRACKLLTVNNQKILTFHSIYDYFALLKAFNTNTLNCYQYFKDKLSSHQPSHMHNTWHRTNSDFNTPLFTHSKNPKFYLYQVIPLWNSLPKLLKNCTSKFTIKKTN